MPKPSIHRLAANSFPRCGTGSLLGPKSSTTYPMYGKPSGLFSRSCSPKTLMLSAADAGVAVTDPAAECDRDRGGGRG